MTITDADFEEVRDWVGSAVSDPDIAAAIDRFDGSTDRAALSLLRRQLADLGPTKWGVAGDYSEDDSGRTAAWLTRQIARLERLTCDPGLGVDVDIVTVGYLYRCDSDR